MKRIILTLIIIFISVTSFAYVTWVTIASNDEVEILFQGKAGSFTFDETENGKPVAVLTGRVVTSESIKFEKWYVSATDCKNGYGTLYTLNLDNEYLYDNSFVFDGGNISSTIAKMICLIAEEELKDRDII